MSVALATKALHLVQELMNDLQLEGLYQDMVSVIERTNKNEYFVSQALY